VGSVYTQPVNPRPRWRSYLLLARLSNLPTVWSNVLAGCVLGGGAADEHLVIHLALAVSALYTGGMFLNDVFDHTIDAVARPERPIPRKDVSVNEAAAIGGGLLVAGASVIALVLAPTTAVFVWVLALTNAILVYDVHHKQNRFAPILMGLCRGLVYCVVAAASGAVTVRVVTAAAVLAAYVAGLSVVARRAGRYVPHLIAGISLIDAAVILAVSGRADLAGLAALAFVLTLIFQRFIPGD
jgi:4-hydroxybenzoate polyprenyltransferase